MIMMTSAPHRLQPQRLAAPAPLRTESEHTQDDAEATAVAQAATEAEVSIDDLCWSWVHWTRTRRLFGKPSAPVSLLGRLRSRSPSRPSTGGPDAACSAELSAFHLAYLAQPISTARHVFDMHYLQGVRDIKTAAAGLGIGRQHWYTLLRQFRGAVHQSSLHIRALTETQRQALPSVQHPTPPSVTPDAPVTSSCNVSPI